MLHVHRNWVGAPAPFGSGYTFAIADTVTTAAAGAAPAAVADEGCEEFLVDPEVFAAMARAHHLYPVAADASDNYFAVRPAQAAGAAAAAADGHVTHVRDHLEAAGHPAFRYFRPDLVHAVPPQAEAAEMDRVSRLNAAFVFRKVVPPRPKAPAAAAATVAAPAAGEPPSRRQRVDAGPDLDSLIA